MDKILSVTSWSFLFQLRPARAPLRIGAARHLEWTGEVITQSDGRTVSRSKMRFGGWPVSVSIRARASGRDLHCGDARARQDRVECFGELPGAVPGQDPEVRGAIAGVHQESADLLAGPRSVRVGGDSWEAGVPRAGFDDEKGRTGAGVSPRGPGGRSRWRGWWWPGRAGTAAWSCRRSASALAGSAGP